MSFHNDFERWLILTEKQNCLVCRQAPMPEGVVDILELPHAWLSAEPVDCLKGACHLTAKQHVIELYELDDDELLSLMKEVQICAKALPQVTDAVKINYEIHGNSLPHLHVHLYPRYQDDPFPDQAIDYKKKERWYTDEEFAVFVKSMQEALVELKS